MNRNRNSNPSFFKILLGDFAFRLALPPYFAQLHRDDLHKNAKLRTSSGETWDVEIEQTDGEGKLRFTEGWTEFVRDANLQLGEFIVFWFDSNQSMFDVAVYGIHGSEKAIQGRSSRSRSLPVDIDDAEIVGEDQKNDDENVMEDARSEAESDAKFEISSCPKFDIKLKNCHKSRMRIIKSFAEEVDLVGKQAVVLEYVPTQRCSIVAVDDKSGTNFFRLELASGWREFWNETGLEIGKTYSFMFNQARNVYQVQPDNNVEDLPSPCNSLSSNFKYFTKGTTTIEKKASKAYRKAKAYWKKTNQASSFISFIQPSYVTCVPIKKSIVTKHVTGHTNNIKLRVSSGQIWEVNVLCSKTTAHISHGWKGFAEGYNIKVGDALVFQVNESDQSIWDVTIFRS